MFPNDVQDWLDAHSPPDYLWFVKRLSGNDTLANRTHQAGPYIPKNILFQVFPDLNRPQELNPDVWFDLNIDSHSDSRSVRAVWYNSKLHDGTRNETRLTNWGGEQSAVLDPESTGALCVFAFRPDEEGATTACNVWVCRDKIEEDVVESHFDSVEPGKWRVRFIRGGMLRGTLDAGTANRSSCWLEPDDLPPSWLERFPAPGQIIEKALELRPEMSLGPDRRLLLRRDCEYEIFRSVEEALFLPKVQSGFTNIEDFTSVALQVIQRRKARSGRSLELHTLTILKEEGLEENREFAYNKRSEGDKRPDFLFPSADAYRQVNYPASCLRMLAVKTTCRERWRQILNEANRIKRKHLLTLQEGLSENQFKEMVDANVQLVVPQPNMQMFPKTVRPHLQTLESFIAEVRTLGLP